MFLKQQKNHCFETRARSKLFYRHFLKWHDYIVLVTGVALFITVNCGTTRPLLVVPQQSTATLTMLWHNLSSIRGQTHKNWRQFVNCTSVQAYKLVKRYIYASDGLARKYVSIFVRKFISYEKRKIVSHGLRSCQRQISKHIFKGKWGLLYLLSFKYFSLHARFENWGASLWYTGRNIKNAELAEIVKTLRKHDASPLFVWCRLPWS